MFPKKRLTTVVLLVLILCLVTACSLFNSPPVASFSVFPNSGSAPLAVSFDASSSSDTTGIIVAYQWEFGDETTGAGKVKTHTYKLPGQYTARLTVTDDDGAKDLTIQIIQVDQAAITASFVANPTSGESPLSVNFDASGSFDPGGESITYAWSFGDGSTGNGVAARHTYYTAGIYAVLLTVRNGSGDEDQVTATIAVSEAPTPGNAKPNAEFTSTPNVGEAPFTVSFDSSGSSDSDGHITSYQWTFGDGESGTGASTSHIYDDSGTYEVWLMVSDNNGATDTANATIQATAVPIPPVANVPPTASFTTSPASGIAPLAVSFNASGSSDSDGTITSYVWSFGDGGSSSGVTPSHTYNSAGAYTAQLTATDDDGATDTATRTIQVSATPVANNPPSASFTASPTSGQAPLTVSFNASSSSDSDGTITSYVWSFGDGGSSSGVTTSHTYNSAGAYIAQLTVTDDDGATDTATRTIQVSATPVANNPPSASFTASPTSGQAPLTVSFNASSSSDSDGTITSYAWAFGDGGSSSGVTTSHTYNSAGAYIAQLTVTDDDGATDTATQTIAVSAAPVSKDLYVDANSGSDAIGDGTSGNPLKTITKALAIAGGASGRDTIHVAPGVYNAALGETFPLTCIEVDLLGEGTTPDDVKIVGTVNVESNSSLKDVRCYTNVTLGGTDALVRNVILKDDTNPVAIRVSGTRLVVEDCLIETCGGGIKASGNQVTIRNNVVRHTNPYGLYGVYVSSGSDVLVTDNFIENEQRGLEMRSGIAESNTIRSCTRGIWIDYTSSPVELRGNSISDGVTTGVAICGDAEVILENNTIGPCSQEGVSVLNSAIVDLGGGSLGGAGGNLFTGNRTNIQDGRTAFSGMLFAQGNTWADPQPSGTVNGPIDNRPNYRISNEGNSIIFSD